MRGVGEGWQNRRMREQGWRGAWGSRRRRGRGRVGWTEDRGRKKERKKERTKKNLFFPFT